MKILKSIGGVFVKIWRWIKNTAWVQPLLIVGTIFGVIFSIPAITRGIQNMVNSSNSADNFYGNYKKSMSGGANSAADKLLDNFVYTIKDKNPAEAAKKLPEEEKRYFLYFTKSNNAQAREAKDAFVTLKDNWSTTYSPKTPCDFRLYTIYADESTSDTTRQNSAFAQFLDRQSEFFEKVASAAEHTNYYISGGITKSDIQTIESCDESLFKIPTMIYVNWDEAPTQGVKEVFFNINGNNKYEKATFLYDCWNSTGSFKK